VQGQRSPCASSQASPKGSGVTLARVGSAAACAGQTAKDFAQNCVQMGSGYQTKDPKLQTPLYLQAGDNERPATLTAIADEILQFCQPG